MDYEINSLGSIGLVIDVEPYQLPPEAWTTATNVVFQDGSPQSLPDDEQVLTNSSIDPHFVIGARSATQQWYVYASLTQVMAHDGTNEFDITGPTTPAATSANEWSAASLGGILVLSDGVNVPQFWAAFDGGTNLADLTNWPATYSCKIIRAFGPYLVAYNIMKGSDEYPHMVKWSHPAVPGTVPTSWDETDLSKDAGENDLSDVDSGIIIEALPLRGSMMIYKNSSTWIQRLIGGRNIFSFDPVFETTGLLSAHCVASINKARFHFCATQDDVMFHDGIQPTSVLEKRLQKYIFANIDTDNYRNCFVFDRVSANEAWFCFPENGEEFPTLALVWNYIEGGPCSLVEVDFRAATLVDLAEASDLAWDDETALDWDTPSDTWNKTSRRQVIVAKPASGLFHLAGGASTTRRAVLQRRDIGLIGMARDRSPIVDFTQNKLHRRIWIKADGGPIDVRIGSSLVPGGAITWNDVQSFDPATQRYLDAVVFGTSLSFEFVSETDFRLIGYKPEIEPLGRF